MEDRYTKNVHRLQLSAIVVVSQDILLLIVYLKIRGLPKRVRLIPLNWEKQSPDKKTPSQEHKEHCYVENKVFALLLSTENPKKSITLPKKLGKYQDIFNLEKAATLLTFEGATYEINT